MKQFNPNDYETVKARKTRFRETHPDGRIMVSCMNPEGIGSYALFKASVFKNADEQSRGLPLGEGYALEIRDKELSRSSTGKEYESVNYTSWTENAEESSVGRALDNGGFASQPKPSREEMQKAQHHAQTLPSLPTQQPSYTDQIASGWPDTVPVPTGKMKGVLIGDLPRPQIENDISYWRKREAAEGKSLTGNILNYVQALEAKLETIKSSPMSVDDIPF